MEFSQFQTTVQNVQDGDVDQVYGELMSKEANTLRIIERVATDTRRETLQDKDVWNMSIRHIVDEYLEFWSDVYVHIMKGETAVLKQKLSSPTGAFNVGLTLAVVAVVIMIVT